MPPDSALIEQKLAAAPAKRFFLHIPSTGQLACGNACLESEALPPVRPPVEPARPVTERERRAIEDVVAPITDPALADSLRRLLVKSRRFS